jgi:hypothetical protein
MRLTWGVALFALLCIGTACSSDEEAQSVTTTEISVTGPTSTPTTSEAPTTTATSTTAPTTTAAPTTTIDPTEALIAEIEADLNEGEQVFLAGAGDPSSETSRANLARYFTDSSLEVLLGFYDSLVTEGLVARPNPDVPSTIRVLELDCRERSTASRRELLQNRCRCSDREVRDGSEAVVNDSIIRYDTVTDFLKRRHLGPSWRRGSSEAIGSRRAIEVADFSSGGRAPA